MNSRVAVVGGAAFCPHWLDAAVTQFAADRRLGPLERADGIGAAACTVRRCRESHRPDHRIPAVSEPGGFFDWLERVQNPLQF